MFTRRDLSSPSSEIRICSPFPGAPHGQATTSCPGAFGFRFSHPPRCHPRTTNQPLLRKTRHGRPARFRIVTEIIKDLQSVQGEKGSVYGYATPGGHRCLPLLLTDSVVAGASSCASCIVGRQLEALVITSRAYRPVVGLTMLVETKSTVQIFKNKTGAQASTSHARGIKWLSGRSQPQK